MVVDNVMVRGLEVEGKGMRLCVSCPSHGGGLL